MYWPIAIPLAGFMAWYKGAPKSKLPKAVALLLYGAAVASCLAPVWPAFAVAAVGLALGLSVGCGAAIGAALENRPPPAKTEWWQKGIMARNQWAAMIGLGVVRAAPVLVLIPLGYTQFAAGLLIASAVAAPLAVKVIHATMGGPVRWYMDPHDPGLPDESARSDAMWRMQDILYGALVCAAAYCLTWAI